MTQKNWWSCNGRGGKEPAENVESVSYTPQLLHSSTPLTRRSLLAGGALAAVGWAAKGATALADLTLNPGRREPDGDVLVTIFLRGGMDGLNVVIPHQEPEYHKHRPVLGIAAPNDSKAGLNQRALDLDGFFGLHPSLNPFQPLFKEGKLGIVHAVGSGDQTRSHFEAMSAMERGLFTDATGTSSGWIARHLTATAGRNNSPLRAIALSSIMPDALRGYLNASAVNSITEFRLDLPAGRAESAGNHAFQKALGELYGGGNDLMAHAGKETLGVLDSLNRLNPEHYRPANGAVYPEGELGKGLKQVACLIKGGVGLEVACLDKGGWDTHYVQGGTEGLQAGLLSDLSTSVAAFAKDLGRNLDRVTVVIMTEFGRRLHENNSLGTDHGRASCMFLLGGGVNGGKVHGKWPGLAESQLEPPGDLRVTTDYRDVLAEVLRKRVGNPNITPVFPGYSPNFHGIVRA